MEFNRESMFPEGANNNELLRTYANIENSLVNEGLSEEINRDMEVPSGINAAEIADGSAVVDDNFARVEDGQDPHEENHTEVNRK